MPISASTRDDTIRTFVEIDPHHQPIARADRSGKFPNGQQQILLQPPIEKRAQPSLHANYPQVGKLVDHHMRHFRRGDQPVPGIPIHKYIYGCARQHTGLAIPPRQQNLPQVAPVEIESRRAFVLNNENIALTDLSHDSSTLTPDRLQAHLSLSRSAQSDQPQPSSNPKTSDHPSQSPSGVIRHWSLDIGH